jgi:endoglucanase
MPPRVAHALALLLVGCAAALGAGSGAVASPSAPATAKAPFRTAQPTPVSPVASAPTSETPEPTPATPSPSASAQPTAAAALLPIHVAGNHLVNSEGNVVTLHGVNRSGTEYMCVQNGGIFDGPSDAASVAAIASWSGVNAVRLGLNEDCWLGINGASINGDTGAAEAQDYQSAIEAYVALLHQYGLYAILALHWSAPGTSEATYQENMPDFDHSPAMWASVAATFKNDPDTIFDLFNEPNNIGIVGCASRAPAACRTAMAEANAGSEDGFWWCGWNGTGCITNQNSAKFGDWQIASMQDMLNAVRGAGASNVVMIGGDEFASDMTGWLAHVPSDPRRQIVASVHEYRDNPDNTLAQWKKYLFPIAAHYPVVIGEFGGGDPWSFDQPLLQFADANGMGYLAWAWDTWADDLITDYTGTPVQGFGTSYRAYLAALAS